MIATSKTIAPGQSFPLQAKPKADGEVDASINGPLSWATSDPLTAIILAGQDQFNVIVKGLVPGTASIIASAQAIPFGPNVTSVFTVVVADSAPLPPLTHFLFDSGAVL